MKVGITGPSGFVGRPLHKRLLKEGYQVVPLTRYPSGLDDEHVIGDVRAIAVANFPRLDAVIHLAGMSYTSERNAQIAESVLYSVNVEGTRRLIEAAAAAGVSNFIFVSSVKAHGESSAPNRPFSENDELQPRSAYGRSKQSAEILVRRMCDSAGISYTILRPPLIYGKMVQGNFLKLAMLSRSPLPLPLGSIQNARSFIYVENLIDIVLRTLFCGNASGEAFLVSDGVDVSTSELLRLLANAQNRQLRLLPSAPIRALVQKLNLSSTYDRIFSNLQVDSSLIKEKLGWTPVYNLQDGLINSFRDI